MANSTLAAIQRKIRRLTRSPSTAQISNDELNEYINTFILYDFPEHLRLFSLRTTFSFYTTANVDVYETDNSLPVSAPLYNFKNKYITTHKPVFIAGTESLFSQDRTEFFSIYPLTASVRSIGSGDGANTLFQGTLPSAPLLQNNVLFGSTASNGDQLVLIDNPVSPLTGELIIPNDPTVSYGDIDYLTGDYLFNFPSAPASDVDVTSETRPYQAALPRALLYFDNKFTVRPVPDKTYKVEMEVYKRPTELLQSGDEPELEQWWQYIAYGAAKKVFEDRMDMESVQLIMPEFKKQETLVLRRTIVQQTKERVATIYTQQADTGSNGNFGFGNGFY